MKSLYDVIGTNGSQTTIQSTVTIFFNCPKSLREDLRSFFSNGNHNYILRMTVKLDIFKIYRINFLSYKFTLRVYTYTFVHIY